MRRIPAALLAATLTLGGASAVFAAPGVDLPTQVADVLGLQEEDEGLEIEVEEDDEPSATALAKREGRGGDGDDSEEDEGENADFVAFVKDLMEDDELSGCERGAMISAVASSGRAGERDFDAADGADTSHCDRDEVTTQDEPGQRGRDRAAEAKANAGGDVDAQDEERGGPPEGKGKPETTGESQSEGKGKPAHAGDDDEGNEGLEEEQEEVEEESEEDDDDSDEDDGPPAHAGKPDGVGGGRPS